MSTARLKHVTSGILVLIGILLYCYTLSYQMVFDDCIYLINNPLFREARSFAFPLNFHAFAVSSAQLGLDRDLSTNLILRPLAYFTFYLNYVFDGLNPRWYRAVNIGIHCANAVLLYHIASFFLQASRTATSHVISSRQFIAAGAALLFLVHPIQTESVTYIVQRFTSMGALFYLVTILTYFLAYASSDKGTASRLHLGSVVSLIAGMLSKEETFTAPFMLVLLDCMVMRTPLRTALKRTIPHFLCLPIIPTLIVMTSWAQDNGDSLIGGAFTIASSTDSGAYRYHYALTQLSVMMSYLRLIVIPFGLNLDRDYPLSTSFFQMPVLVSLALIVSILVGSWYYYRRRQEDLRSALLFCSTLWFFLTLLPSSSLAPLPDLMADHRSYLPSMGALLALACCADLLRTQVFNQREGKLAMNVFMAAWILGLSVATVARNYVWRSPTSLWKDTAMKSPGKWRPWSNLAAAYYEIGRPSEAIDCLTKAIDREPDYVSGYMDLAMVQNEQGRYREALEVSKAGLKRSLNNYRMLYNLGVSYCAIEQMKSAIKVLSDSVAICGTYKPAHIKLATAYSRLEQYDKALAEYKIAESLPPFDPRLRPKLVEAQYLASQHHRIQTIGLPLRPLVQEFQ